MFSFDDEIREAKAYIEEKLWPCSTPEESWDLYQRCLIGVSFAAFAQAIGSSRKVFLTDGRGRNAKRK